MFFFTISLTILFIVFFRSHFTQTILFTYLANKTGYLQTKNSLFNISKWLLISPTGAGLVLQKQTQKKEFGNDEKTLVNIENGFVKKKCQIIYNLFRTTYLINDLNVYNTVLNSNCFSFNNILINNYFDTDKAQAKFYKEVLLGINIEHLYQTIQINCHYPTKNIDNNLLKENSRKLVIDLIFGKLGKSNLDMVESTAISKNFNRDYQRVISNYLNSDTLEKNLCNLTRQSGELISCERLAILFSEWYLFYFEIFSNNFPKLITLLLNRPTICNQIISNLKTSNTSLAFTARSCQLLRRAILETFRLCPMRLTSEFNQLIPKQEKATLLYVFNSYFLRDSKIFRDPDCFEPNRWINKSGLENSYFPLMWNLTCSQLELKEFAITVLQLLTADFFDKVHYDIKNLEYYNLDINNIQLLNPNKLFIKIN